MLQNFPKTWGHLIIESMQKSSVLLPEKGWEVDLHAVFIL